jgi:hypothetical protein
MFLSHVNVVIRLNVCIDVPTSRSAQIQFHEM